MSLQRVEIITEGAVLLFSTKAVTWVENEERHLSESSLGKKLLSLRSLSSFSPVFIRYGFNILRFKFLNLKSSIVPSVWQKLSRGMSRPTTSKKWENPNIFIFLLLFTSIHFLQKHLISLHSFFLLFSFTYTFTYLLYEGSSMKFWSTGVPCLDVMGLDTPLESFCHTEGTVDK